MQDGRLQGAPRGQLGRGLGGDTTRSIPQQQPLQGWAPKEVFPPIPAGEGVWEPGSPSPAGTRVGHAWEKSHLVFGSCKVTWLSLPGPGELGGGGGITPSLARGDVPVQELLPHTQGPRWAFKTPFITTEPSRLKSQSPGARGGFLVEGVGLGLGFFFCFKFLSEQN